MLRAVFIHVVLVAAFFAYAYILSSDDLTFEPTKRATGAGLSNSDPSPHLDVTGNPSKWWGRYHLDTDFDGDFYQFTHVYLSSNENDLSNARLSPEGFDQLAVEKLTIRDDTVTFETHALGGEWFSFTGSFTKVRCGVDLETNGMEGHLVKLREGKVIAVKKASFHRVYGC